MILDKCKKISIIILFLIMFIIPIPVLAGTSTDGSTSSYSVEGCKLSWHYCWRNSGTSFELQGIRVTAYNEKGKRMSDSFDFTNNYNAMLKINSSSYYTSGGRRSKVDYANSSSFNKSTTTPTIHYAGFKSFIQMGINTSSSIENFFKSNKEEIERQLNICNGDYATNCSNEGYLVIEPLTIIWSRHEPYDYYGTYYELSSMIENGPYPFEKGNGVSPFLPGNIAMSLYITGGTSFNDFYKKIGLNPLSSSNIKDVSQYINDYNHSGLKYITVNTPNSGYGIAVLIMDALTTNPTITSKSCSGEDCTIPNCNPKTPKIDICYEQPGIQNSGSIQYEYENCLMDNNSSNYKTYRETENKICQIQCNEKYYIDTAKAYYNFHPINNSGRILAGTYFPIDSPVVYHKKSCNYYFAQDVLERNAAADATITTCIVVSGSEICTESFSSEEYQALMDKSKKDCDNLKSKFDTMVSNNTDTIEAKSDIVGETTLELVDFNNSYDLVPNKTATKIRKISLNEEYEWGYHNTFVYSIKGDINKYISMKTSYNDNTNVPSPENAGDGIAKASTPITAIGYNTSHINTGTYYYQINYKNIFSTNLYFSEIMNNLSLIGSKQKCSYVLEERNIRNYCIPNVSNNYCSNPDTSFQIPKIKMVYRPIDLNNPFPGISGNGRTPGSNWNSEAIYQYITNNRYVEDNPENVYTDKKTLYTIKLDANSINKIREYNKTHSYDDFTLNCTDGSGTECLSTFLRNIEYVSLSGDCSTVTTSDRRAFYSCANK